MEQKKKHHQKLWCCIRDLSGTYKQSVLLKNRQDKKMASYLTLGLDTFEIFWKHASLIKIE